MKSFYKIIIFICFINTSLFANSTILIAELKNRCIQSLSSMKSIKDPNNLCSCLLSKSSQEYTRSQINKINNLNEDYYNSFKIDMLDAVDHCLVSKT